MWAAVLNKAVAQLRSYHDSSRLSRDSAFFLSPQVKQTNSMLNLGSTSPDTTMAARAKKQARSAKVASNEQDWDTSLHLPPWVSSSERLQIEAKLDHWVQDLYQVTLLQPAVACLQLLMSFILRRCLACKPDTNQCSHLRTCNCAVANCISALPDDQHKAHSPCSLAVYLLLSLAV